MNSSSTEPTRSLVNRIWARWLIAFLLLNGTITMTITWFLSKEYPWGHILLLWVGQILAMMLVVANRKVRLGLVYSATVVGVLGGYELWLAYRAPKDATSGIVRSYPMDYFQNPYRDILGYGPKPSSKSTIEMLRDGQKVYSAVYTYDRNGKRITPDPIGADTLGQIALFGCSFTLGEGLNDTETTAWKLAELTHRRKVHNFGFHGWGPHQMLSMLEHGLVQRQSSSEKNGLLGIYQAIPDHIRRVAGLALYDRHGPKYVLDASGEARPIGHFDDNFLLACLRRSRIWQSTSNAHLNTDSVDIATWAAVVDKSRKIVEGMGHGSRFQVVLWDIPSKPDIPAMEGALQRKRIPFRKISELLPLLKSKPTPYFIALDEHPSALANRELAVAFWNAWIVDWIAHGN